MEVYIVSDNLPIPNAPAGLAAYPQFACWRYNADKSKKPPVDPLTGRPINWTDPETWISYEEATAAVEERDHDGVGFVLTEEDPWCGFDLDRCLDAESGEVHPAAWWVIESLDSYTEVSPSGTGLRVWTWATKPGTECSTARTPWDGKIEIYDRDRFLTVTGNVVRPRPIRDAQGAVDGVYERFLVNDPATVVTPFRAPSKNRTATLSDDEVLEKARSCGKTGARFSELYDRGSSVPRGERSEQDAFVCWCLARSSGGCAEQVKRLFRLSDLAGGKYAEKGQQGEKYLDLTVDNAIRKWEQSHDPNFGERMRTKVREAVRKHRDRLNRSNLRGSRRAVVGEMLDIAEEVGSLKKRGVTFNANQSAVGEAVGVSQKMVSKIMAGLLADGWLVRVTVGKPGKKGKPGKNSKYRLPFV